MDKPGNGGFENDGGGFAAEAQRESQGLVREFWDFAKHNKKWWLIPIIVVLLLVGLLVVLAGTAASPFIYTLF